MSGVTYRIERTAPHCYAVVRLLDDVSVGTFCTTPALRMHPKGVDDNTMRDIVKAAMRSARTSAVMHLAPELPPENNREENNREENNREENNREENNRESSAGPASTVTPSPRAPSTVPPPEQAIARA